jgi:heme A synthase
MSRAAFVRFAWIALAITVVVILWGAVVRATGSGAGCGSHWPLCDGQVVPLDPGVGTMIEYTHRLTSGIAMLLSLALLILARRVFPAGHRARVWAAAAFAFMMIEAAIGAGLVILGLVADDASSARAVYVGAHLVNTMLLVGALTGTVWWASQPAALATPAARRSPGLTATLVLMLFVAASGAVVALGDTLFPHGSLAEGLRADLDPSSHFLVRLRVWHPVLAGVAAIVVLWLARRDPVFLAPGADRRRTTVTLLVLAQAGIGVLTLALLAPLPMQIGHLLGSNLLWIALVWSWMIDSGQSR